MTEKNIDQMEPSQTSIDEAVSVLERFGLQANTSLVEAVAQAIEAAFQDGYQANQMEVVIQNQNPRFSIPSAKEGTWR